jgi:hypothetical protein
MGHHRLPRLVLLALFTPIFLTLFSISCSEETAPSGSDTDDFIATLPTWEEFSPVLPDTNDIVGPGTASEEIVGGNRYSCVSSPYSLTHTPDKIVTMDPDINILWLGGLLQGNGYRGGIGSMMEWGVRERAPLKVAVDFLTGSNTRVVDHPDLGSVTSAVGAMVQQAHDAGHRGGSSVSFSMQKTYSSIQGGASLGLSTRYFGPTITASLNAGRSANETTITAYFVQRMFTASIVLPNTPADMFSDEFTPARLDEERNRGNVGSDNIPVYVASIVYGRSLLFTMTSNTTEDSIRMALSVSVGKDSGGLGGRLLNILNTSRIGVVTVGGEGRNATALIQSGELKDYFNEDAALTSARPISYTIRNLGDNSIAKVSESTDYNLKECEAIPTTGRINIDVTPNDATVSVLGPGGYSFSPKTGDQSLSELVPGGYAVTVSRAGFDTAFVDVTVVAGETEDVPVNLNAPNNPATGSIYRITPRRLNILATSCSGESQVDVFHSVTVNGRVLTDRTEPSYIPLYAGQFDDPSKGPQFWHTVTDTVWFTGSRTKLAFSAIVYDSDLNAPDLMSASNWSYTAPNIAVGLGLVRNLNLSNASCRTSLVFDLEKIGDVMTPAP